MGRKKNTLTKWLFELGGFVLGMQVGALMIVGLMILVMEFFNIQVRVGFLEFAVSMAGGGCVGALYARAHATTWK